MPILDGKSGRPRWTHYTYSLTGELLAAGAARNIIQFGDRDQDIALRHPKKVQEIREALGNCEIELDYLDYYKTRYTIRSNLKEKYGHYAKSAAAMKGS